MTDMATTGRKRKLTPDIQAAILEALTAGNYYDTSAHYAGISTASLHAWMARGRAEKERQEDGQEPNPDEEMFVEFLEAVEKARASAEVRSVALIRRAAMEGTWQAAAWFLERSHPKKWGRVDRHEVAGPDGGPVAVSVSADQLESKVAEILGDKPASG